MVTARELAKPRTLRTSSANLGLRHVDEFRGAAHALAERPQRVDSSPSCIMRKPAAVGGEWTFEPSLNRLRGKQSRIADIVLFFKRLW
jgi:hypothetical protein